MPWKDKTKEKAYRREYYQKNRDQKLAVSRRRRQNHPEASRNAYRKITIRKIELVNDIKRKSRCSMCGRSFPDCPSVIDFHHEGKESKSDGVAQLVGHHAPDEVILAEIAKCIPLCANCHRIVHDIEKQKGKSGLVRSPVKKSSSP